MTALRNAAFAVALALTAAAPAAAMPVADLSAFGTQTFEERLATGESLRFTRDEAVETAMSSYFDFDALITFGVLALAGGAFAGFGAFAARKARAAEMAEPAWRETVLRAVQADLAAFSDSFRRAA